LGYNFKVGADKIVTPEALTLNAVSTGFELEDSKLEWFGSNNFEDWEKLQTGLIYYLDYNTLS